MRIFIVNTNAIINYHNKVYVYIHVPSIRSIYARISDHPSILPILSSYTCLINYPVLARLITAARSKLWFRWSGQGEFAGRFRCNWSKMFLSIHFIKMRVRELYDLLVYIDRKLIFDWEKWRILLICISNFRSACNFK